tara:strand:+ start:26231 stop:26380 length:150 start_codon:yes stop_codon:yes gene_type:complete
MSRSSGGNELNVGDRNNEDKGDCPNGRPCWINPKTSVLIATIVWGISLS